MTGPTFFHFLATFFDMERDIRQRDGLGLCQYCARTHPHVGYTTVFPCIHFRLDLDARINTPKKQTYVWKQGWCRGLFSAVSHDAMLKPSNHRHGRGLKNRTMALANYLGHGICTVFDGSSIVALLWNYGTCWFLAGVVGWTSRQPPKFLKANVGPHQGGTVSIHPFCQNLRNRPRTPCSHLLPRKLYRPYEHASPKSRSPDLPSQMVRSFVTTFFSRCAVLLLRAMHGPNKL